MQQEKYPKSGYNTYTPCTGDEPLPLNWMDVTTLSFNNLLLLEKVQLSWLPGWLPPAELALALRANPVVEWYLRHKCPELNPWLDKVMAQPLLAADGAAVRAAEVSILQRLEDLLVYAIDPDLYDRQPFLGWDSRELTSLADFTDRTVLDIGAGTGRLALSVASMCRVVFCVEPVANLRETIHRKARQRGLDNVYALDGLITAIPFPAGFADLTIGGNVFGDDPSAEWEELTRVTRRGGMIILCPGNNDADNAIHAFLSAQGCHWSRFEQPGDGWKRKYWKTLDQGGGG